MDPVILMVWFGLVLMFYVYVADTHECILISSSDSSVVADYSIRVSSASRRVTVYRKHYSYCSGVQPRPWSVINILVKAPTIMSSP